MNSITQTVYSDFIESLPNPSALAVFNLNPLKGSAFLEISPSIAFTVIDRMFGGKGEASVIKRELSEIEKSALKGITVKLLENLRHSFSGIADLSPEIGSIETNPQFIHSVPQNDKIVLISFQVRIGESEGALNICIPYKIIESIPAASMKTEGDGSFRKREEDEISRAASDILKKSIIKRYIEYRINDQGLKISEISQWQKGQRIEISELEQNRISDLLNAETEVEAEFGKARLSIEDMENLRAGSVIRLDLNTSELLTIEEYREFAKSNSDKFKEIIKAILQNNKRINAGILVLALEEDTAVSVLQSLQDSEREQVILSISKLKIVSQSDIRNTLAEFSGILSSFSFIGGIDRARALTEKAVGAEKAASLDRVNPELAEEIKKRLFVFEDIVLLDDRAVQKVMREIDNTDLAKALKSVDSEVQEKIFKNMSKRAGQLLRKDMDFMGPVRLKDVEDSQQKIVNIIRILEEQGEIVVARFGEDELVV